MKIGIEAQRIFRKKKHGMDIYALELIRAIQKLDHTNEYVVFVKADEDECLYSSDNMKVVKVKGLTYIDWEQVWLPKAVKRSGVEMVHYTSNTASLHCPVPFLVTLHDIIYLTSFSGGTLYQTAGHFYRKFIVPRIIKKAEYVFTVSDFEKTQITQAIALYEHKIKVVPNAINTTFRKIKNEEILQNTISKYHLPSEFILFIGNEAPKKNMQILLKAYANYVDKTSNPLQLVILETSIQQILNHLAKFKRLDILDKITLTGYVDHSDLPKIYNLARLFLYPSLRESFGIPIIEAMACGTPVITSNTTAMPEIADNAAYLINPLNVSELSEAIIELTQNPTLRDCLIEKGLKRAEGFSWKNTAYLTQKTYLYKS
jgi:glycosyltransferase involved in cell wall biosynthesis